MRQRTPFAFLLAGLFFLLFTGLLAFLPNVNSLAAPPAQETQEPEAGQQDAAPDDIPNETCLGCHGQPGMTMELGNGQTLSLAVSAEDHALSVHGRLGLRCVDCHTDVGNYPHPPFEAADVRDVTLKLYPLCQRCHQDQFEDTQDSVHENILESGNRNAAVCIDCHTAHTVRRLNNPITGENLPQTRVWIPQTCAQCHSVIYTKYKNSVHGQALVDQNNPDVPTCVNCHGVHTIADPGTNSFRLRSPEICGDCHRNPQIMNKYGISTAVFETYVSDFHGTTVTLFSQQHPDQEANEAVCYDCHGVHDILSPRDPEKGLQVKQNILIRCQACHPGATENFPTAWLSHYIPSPSRHPLVFTVNLFYKIFIPVVLGGMAILVALDLGKALRSRGKRAEHLVEPSPLADVVDAEPGPPAVFIPTEAPPQETSLSPAELEDLQDQDSSALESSVPDAEQPEESVTSDASDEIELPQVEPPEQPPEGSTPDKNGSPHPPETPDEEHPNG